jgi:hypothetical protein
MPGTTLALVEGGQEAYQCYYDWHAVYEAGVRPYNDAKQRAFDESVAEFLGDPPPTHSEMWQFHVLIETPNNISVRDVYTAKLGTHRPFSGYRGVGDTKRKAEEAAWKHYQDELACTHEFHRIGGSNLNGDVMCRHCKRYVHDYYMDPVVHAARNWASRFYGVALWEDTEFKIITHVGAVVGRVQQHPEFGTPTVVAATWLSGVRNFQVHDREAVVGDVGEKVVALAEAVKNPGSNEVARYIRLCRHAEDVRFAGSKIDFNPTVRKRLVAETEQALALCDGTDPALEKYITGWVNACYKKSK